MVEASTVPDLVIRQATVIDGTGAPARVADVAVCGDRIVQVADRIEARAAVEIDAKGQVLAPGFIDVPA